MMALEVALMVEELDESSSRTVGGMAREEVDEAEGETVGTEQIAI